MKGLFRVVLVLAALAPAACREAPAMLREMDARHRTAVVQARLAEASDASNRAVLADTDAVSVAAAAEARDGWAAVQAETRALQDVLDGLGYAPEAATLREFATAFEAYVQTDRTILELAVANSNLKAQQLAHGPASAAADQAVAELEAVRAQQPTPAIRALVAEASLGVREIQALQAPHNAAPADAEMTRLEEKMRASAARTTQALAALRDALPQASRPRLDQAAGQWATFQQLNEQFIVLSRGNTNVRSLALTQTEKGRHLEACDRALTTLVAALEKRGSAGSR